MKKITKHKFSHPDPEKTTHLNNNTSKGSRHENKKDPHTERELILAKKDLRGSIVFIFIFLVMLGVFYFINNHFNLFEKAKNLI